MQNYTDTANGDAPLTCDILCVISLVSLSSGCAHVLLGRKTKATDQYFFYKKYFYSMTIEITRKNQSICQIRVVLKITFKRF